MLKPWVYVLGGLINGVGVGVLILGGSRCMYYKWNKNMFHKDRIKGI